MQEDRRESDHDTTVTCTGLFKTNVTVFARQAGTRKNTANLQRVYLNLVV